jgi:hypothetical protein
VQRERERNKRGFMILFIVCERGRGCRVVSNTTRGLWVLTRMAMDASQEEY